MLPRRRVRVAGLTEAWLALPWLGWSWLSIQFIGIPSEAVYHLVLTVWLISVGAIFVPHIEALLATKVHRLRPPSEWELRRLGPARFAVCTAAGVDPDRYRVWVYEGPDATAPVVAGSTVAVSNWSIYTLPPRNLEAVLAHELAHHLALPRLVSLFIYWLSLPARVMGLVIAGGLKHPVLSLPVKLVLGFLTVGVFLVGSSPDSIGTRC